MNRIAILGVAALALVGCSKPADSQPDGPIPPADAPAEAVPPADAPVAAGPEFSKPMRAVGTEPFWSLEIQPAALVLTGPDREALSASHGGPKPVGDAVMFEGQSAAGAPLTVTLRAEPCSDGMSDLAFPYKATVEAGAETLAGCAAAVDAWPKQPD